MKRYILILVLILVIPMSGNVRKWDSFLLNQYDVETAIDIVASATATNGTDFTSDEIAIEHSAWVLISVTFARAAGSSSTVDVELEVSSDHKNSWSTYRSGSGTSPMVQVRTDSPVISGTTVKMSYQINGTGISHFRIKDIENTDSSNAITAVQVQISM